MLNKKLWAVYEYIARELYAVREDLEVDGKRYSSQLLFALLGFLLREPIWLVGNYGSGKTSLAELLGCLLGGLPYSAVRFTVLRGNPQVTEDKICGLVDLGALQSGKVIIIWSPFVRSPVKIVDEITRIPEIKQSLLLEGVRTGQWQIYGRVFSYSERTPLFATANFEETISGGSFNLVPALIDRFAIGLTTEYPGVEGCIDLVLNGDLEARVEKAGLNTFAEEGIRLLSSEEFNPQALYSFRQEFKENLYKRGIPTLTDKELFQAEEEIRGLDIGPDASLFLRFFISALNACPKAGQKGGEQFGDHEEECPETCKFYDSPCSWVLGGGSRRVETALGEFARAAAWFRGASQVEQADVATVAPFVLWHRRRFARPLMREAEFGPRRGYPVKLEAAFNYVERMAQEFTEQCDILQLLCEHKNRVVVKTVGKQIFISLNGQTVKASELLMVVALDILNLLPLSPAASSKEEVKQ